MYSAIIDAVVGVLSENQLRAMQGFPESATQLRAGTLVCVSVKDARSLSSGMGEYLGRSFDPQGNDKGEIYGLKLEMVIGLDIFAPPGEGHGAAECLEYYGAISRALSSLPAGLKIKELRCGAAEPDSLTEGYKCPAEIHCVAHIIGEADADTGEFLDFNLKGVLRQ